MYVMCVLFKMLHCVHGCAAGKCVEGKVEWGEGWKGLTKGISDEQDFGGRKNYNGMGGWGWLCSTC